MNWRYVFGILLGILPLFFGYASGQQITDRRLNETFPENIAFHYKGQPYRLEKTGAAIRKKFFVKVYRVASYLQDPSSVMGADIFANILNSSKAKQLSFQWLRNASQTRVREDYRETFSKVTSGNQAEIDQFIGFFGEVKKGDTHDLRWFPDNTVTVIINDQVMGSIKSDRFAKTLWSIWFGDKSVVDRNKLIAMIR